eukprot:m.38658 g.38658  ORF g.38658 m.38658 type:complete len:155 (+) comp32621_c0_seq4:409-873(+)
MAASQQQQALANKEPPDPVSEAKILMPVLKKALLVLMRSAYQTLQYSRSFNNSNNSQRRDVPEVPGRMDQHLEEFYAIVDQIQQCLMTALDSLVLASDSNESNPLPVDIGTGGDRSGGTQTYGEYLASAQIQADYVKKLHELLEEFIHSISSNK